MNLARAIVNDMLRSSAGQTLKDSRPFTREYLNAAVADCQEYLANNGISSYIKDNVLLSNLTPCTSADPSTQVYVSVEGYFDGSTISPDPVLPVDMILPLMVWERQQNAGQQFVKVEPVKDGLPSAQPGACFGVYDWLEDRLAFVGSTETRELRIRYEAALPEIGTTDNLAEAIIRIRGGKRAVAFGVAEYYAAARGAPQQTWAETQKKQRLDELVNRQVRKDQRIAFRPRGYNTLRGRVDGGLSGTFK
jgi:hypothetical protein